MTTAYRSAWPLVLGLAAISCTAQSRERPAREPAALLPVAVEAQPLAANVQRLVDALDYLGAPLPAGLRADLASAGQTRDAARLQQLLDSRVLLAVHINPEARVKVERGPAPAVLQQAGYTPVLVKVVNVERRHQALAIGSPQSGPVYAGMSALRQRLQQAHLRENENTAGRTDRFLQVEMFTARR